MLNKCRVAGRLGRYQARHRGLPFNTKHLGETIPHQVTDLLEIKITKVFPHWFKNIFEWEARFGALPHAYFVIELFEACINEFEAIRLVALGKAPKNTRQRKLGVCVVLATAQNIAVHFIN